MVAEMSVRQAYDEYSDASRALLTVPHLEHERSEQDKELIERTGQLWAEVVRLEDRHRRVRADVNQIINKINAKLAGPASST